VQKNPSIAALKATALIWSSLENVDTATLNAQYGPRRMWVGDIKELAS